MKKVLVVVTVVIAVLIALPLVLRITRGPIPPTDSARPRSTSPVQSASQGPGVANEAITLWSQGRNEDALVLLLEGKRPGSAPGPLLECLSISEAQFVRLPAVQRSEIAQQYQQTANAARALSRAAIAKINQGGQANAAVYKTRVKDFGNQLAGPEYSLILQRTGQAIAKAAAQ